MAEHIELHEDVDPDLTWYDWGHFLEHDHRCIPGILAGLPAATNPQDDTLRTLAVRRWLLDMEYNGGELQVGYDAQGCLAEGPDRQPYLRIELTLEDMSTRPALITQYKAHMATTHEALARLVVGQWLPFSEEIELDEIEAAHANRVYQWFRMIHEQEVAWFSRQRSGMMAVVVIEGPDGDTVGVVNCLDEIATLPMWQRGGVAIKNSDTQASFIRNTLQPLFPDVKLDWQYSVQLHYCAPTPGRMAKLRAREIDQATVEARHPGRGPRL